MADQRGLIGCLIYPKNFRKKGLISGYSMADIITIDLPGLMTGTRALRLVRIPAGQFLMGSPEKEEGRFTDEGRLHPVQIGYDFYLGETELTQAYWEAIMGKNPSHFKGAEHPVERVSWDDCQDLIKRLNSMGRYMFRLPSEAEWEYACRAGSQTTYFYGDDPDKLVEYAWYDKNANRQTHPVAQKKPNPWGLYDMHGNVWEWCEDDWHESYIGAPTNGKAWIDVPRGSRRALRGGYWINETGDCRSAYRHWGAPSTRGFYIGIRIACATSPQD